MNFEEIKQEEDPSLEQEEHHLLFLDQSISFPKKAK